MRRPIYIHDNCYIGETFSKDTIIDLLPFGNKSIEQLCNEHDGLLVFPHCLKDSNDKIAKEHIFDFALDVTQENVTVTTRNIMGFIGSGDCNMKIYSRFDKAQNDYFLHYMLEKVFSINIFNMNHTYDTDSAFDLLLFIFPHFLNRALRQGIYRQYTRYEYNDENIKGTIDVSRHISHNIPFQGKVAYNTREYSRDNNVTELIRHTIEFISAHHFGKDVLYMDKDTQLSVKTIIDNTPFYNKGQRRNIIQRNLRFPSHPYYTEYLPLVQLCIRILRYDEIKFGESEYELHGILFDGSWLWEEYCNTILEKCGYSHPNNKKGIGRICLFEKSLGARYPDFIKDDFVIDAKYKCYDKLNHPAHIQRDDIHQIITYMYMTKSKHGAVLSPFQNHRFTIATGELNGYGGTINIYGINIPNHASDYNSFSNMMSIEEKKLEEILP